MARCISGDPMCGIWTTCRLCRAEAAHQEELLSIRREGELIRERRIARDRANEAVAELIVENPGTTLGIIAGIAAVAGIAKTMEYNKRLSKKYGRR
jgi:hypothetical protein